VGRSILGNRVLRREDPDLLRGRGRYVGNLALEGAAHVVFVRATVARARITAIDVAAAAAVPGVLAVVTAADVDLADLASAGRPEPAFARPILARDAVTFVGEPVAAVVAVTRAVAVDAAELVLVDYDEQPAVVDPVVALAAADDPIFPGAPNGNVAATIPAAAAVDLSDCEVVVTQAMVNQRVAACPIEPRVGACRWTEDGRIEYFASTQGAHTFRDQVAKVYGLEKDRVRVVSADVGGGFGAKGDPHPEELLLPLLARRVGRPVTWSESRTENMTAMVQGRDQLQTLTLGGTRDGRITHARLEVVQGAGGHVSFGAMLPALTRMMMTGVYAIGQAEFTSTSVITNTTPVSAYRGAGRPEAAAGLERALDVYAAAVGLDAVEIRRRNFVPNDAFPFTTPSGTTYDIGDYSGALDRVLEAAGWDELRAEQARRRAAGDPRLLGIGLACYVEITGFDPQEFGSVELRADGSVLAKTGSNPYGQGHHTTWAMIVSDRLGIPLERIDVVHGDTDEIPSGYTTGGSRSVQIAGSSIADASERLVSLARAVAADLLEANPDDVVLDTDDGGRFHVAGTPTRSVGWDDVAARQAAAGPSERLVGISEFVQEGATFPFGAHVCVVEVDAETGQVEVLRFVACDDAGVIINPLLAEGQIHGGLAQGIAQALYEEVRHDELGNPLTANFADYAIPSAAEMPSFERIPMETRTPRNPLGAKGIGESGTVGSTPAAQNAVIDAVAHLGVTHIDLPCTPERVWRAMAAARPS
jgi:carbon-monoxide dehydrogenase large subunit